MDTTERRTALVTGASSGIGSELARELAKRGHDLIVTARREDRLLALKDEIARAHRVEVHVVVADLGRPEGVKALLAGVEAIGRAVDVLVNNAGFGLHGKFWEHDPARVDEMIQLNMTTLTTLTAHYAKQMVARRRGRILQVSSVGAFQPSPYYAAYAATKAYVLQFSEAANHELRGTGVSITTVCPGLTATEFHDVAEHPKKGLVATTVMSASDVARTAITAMLRGRAVVTPGLVNKLSAWLVRLMPRSWVTAMAAMLMCD